MERYDLIIIGGGPAAVAAGVYAARKRLATLVVTREFGGQSIVSDEIQNWIGATSISGLDLARRLEEHLRAQEGIEIAEGETVVAVSGAAGEFTVKTESGKSFVGKTLLLAQGSGRKKLEAPGEERLNGRGVAYCATCDAPLFKGKAVAVVGGGNSALESVIDLLDYAEKVYLLVRSGALKGDPVTQEKVRAAEKVTILYNAETREITGETAVSGLRYLDRESGEERELALGGVFVEIGSRPNSEIVRDLVALNERGEVVVDHKTQQSSREGIWAAGDVSDVLYKQNNISAGDAIKAVLNITEYLRARK